MELIKLVIPFESSGSFHFLYESNNMKTLHHSSCELYKPIMNHLIYSLQLSVLVHIVDRNDTNYSYFLLMDILVDEHMEQEWMLDEWMTQDEEVMIDNNELDETPILFLLLQQVKHPLDLVTLINKRNHESSPQAITTAEARALFDGKSDKNRCIEMKSKPSSFYYD